MENTKIMEALAQIRSDLIQIKRRLSIGDPDQFKSGSDRSDQNGSGTDRDYFFQDCSDLGIDIEGIDIGTASRSIDYYCLNRWRITNKKSYLEKLVKPHMLSGSVKRIKEQDQTIVEIMGVDPDAVEYWMNQWDDDTAEKVLKIMGPLARSFRQNDGVYDYRKRKILVTWGISKGALEVPE